MMMLCVRVSWPANLTSQLVVIDGAFLSCDLTTPPVLYAARWGYGLDLPLRGHATAIVAVVQHLWS